MSQERALAYLHSEKLAASCIEKAKQVHEWHEALDQTQQRLRVLEQATDKLSESLRQGHVFARAMACFYVRAVLPVIVLTHMCVF